MSIQFNANMESTRINACWISGDIWSVNISDGETSVRLNLSTLEVACLACLVIGFGETIETTTDEEKALVAYMYAKLKGKLLDSPRVIP